MVRRASAGPDRRSGMSRRALMQGTGGLGVATFLATRATGSPAATLVQSTPAVDISGTSLSILQWSHFVPAFNEWFRDFLQEWGDEHRVEVSVDMINTADVPATFADEISAGSGHDIVEHVDSLAQYEESVLDLRDLVEEAERRHGPQLEMARANAYNPTTDTYYGFCHGYAPDPVNYRRSLWAGIGMDNGPATYDELVEGGTQIWNEQGVQLGIGMSQEYDSNMAAQVMLWAFGAAVQDENENIVINSPEAVECVTFMKTLFESAMTPDVFDWDATSNNQMLEAGQASYILNSISAFRAAQKQQPEVAEDIFFGAPLVGPGGENRAVAHGHGVYIAMIPTYSENQDTAKEFLLHLTANYEAAVLGSELDNFPAFPDTFPGLTEDGGPLDNDPEGAEPPDKLAPLKTAEDWSVNLGWPGPANAMIGEAFNSFVLSDMMAHASRGDMTPAQAVEDAEQKLNEIADRWRGEGLMGGGQ